MNTTEERLQQLGQEIAMFVNGRQPRYRYWSRDGFMYCYTTERMADGKFSSWVYAPRGKGSRSGDASMWEPTREVHHSTRKAAKARAYRLLTQAATKGKVNV